MAIRTWFVEDDEEIYGLVIQCLLEIETTPNQDGVKIVPRIILTQLHYEKHDPVNDLDLDEIQRGQRKEDQREHEEPDDQVDDSTSK